MKRVNNKIGLIVLTMLVAVAIPMAGNCQPDPGGAPDVPLDGGVTLLLAAAGVAGVKKMRDNQKKNKEML
ncbi:MAG: PID-CTERM protein-sorting domain-containing protein [Chitinophagaceae bacterium]